MFVRGVDDQRRTRQCSIRLDVQRGTLALAETIVTCKLAILGTVGGMTVPCCRTKGRSEDLLCDITLGSRRSYDDDLPEELP